MPKPQLFHVAAGTVAVLGVVSASVAVAGSLRWGAALLAATISCGAVLVVLSDRRTQIASNRRARELATLKEDTVALRRAVSAVAGAMETVRRGDDAARADMRLVLQEVRSTAQKVDAMQRRVVAGLEAVRLDAADRQGSAENTPRG